MGAEKTRKEKSEGKQGVESRTGKRGSKHNGNWKTDWGSPSSSQQELEAVTATASGRYFRPERRASHKGGWAACQPVDFSSLEREREAWLCVSHCL